MINLLLVDTAGKFGQIGIGNEQNELLAVKTCAEANQQAADLNIMIQEGLAEAHLELKNMDAFAVCGGPGSYTCLRVGMSAVKGFCFALSKPLMVFDRLQLIALTILSKESTSKPVVVILKARKGEYFMGSFDAVGRHSADSCHIFEKDLPDFNQDVLIASDIPEIEKRTSGDGFRLLQESAALSLNAWLPLAISHFKDKKFDDLAYSEPLYLKPAFTTTPKKMI